MQQKERSMQTHISFFFFCPPVLPFFVCIDGRRLSPMELQNAPQNRPPALKRPDDRLPVCLIIEAALRELLRPIQRLECLRIGICRAARFCFFCWPPNSRFTKAKRHIYVFATKKRQLPLFLCFTDRYRAEMPSIRMGMPCSFRYCLSVPIFK